MRWLFALRQHDVDVSFLCILESTAEVRRSNMVKEASKCSINRSDCHHKNAFRERNLFLAFALETYNDAA